MPLTVVNHAINEANKTIQITLSGASKGLSLGTTTGVYTILNAVPAPNVAFVSATGSAQEGKSGTLTVGLFDAAGQATTSGQTVTVGYTFGAPGDTAVAGVNFKSISGTAYVRAGAGNPDRSH